MRPSGSGWKKEIAIFWHTGVLWRIWRCVFCFSSSFFLSPPLSRFPPRILFSKEEGEGRDTGTFPLLPGRGRGGELRDSCHFSDAKDMYLPPPLLVCLARVARSSSRSFMAFMNYINVACLIIKLQMKSTQLNSHKRYKINKWKKFVCKFKHFS